MPNFLLKEFFCFLRFLVEGVISKSWCTVGNIYVYTNRHVKIVYLLKVNPFAGVPGLPGIWISTRMVALMSYCICTYRVHAHSHDTGGSGVVRYVNHLLTGQRNRNLVGDGLH